MITYDNADKLYYCKLDPYGTVQNLLERQNIKYKKPEEKKFFLAHYVDENSRCAICYKRGKNKTYVNPLNSAIYYSAEEFEKQKFPNKEKLFVVTQVEPLKLEKLKITEQELKALLKKAKDNLEYRKSRFISESEK